MCIRRNVVQYTEEVVAALDCSVKRTRMSQFRVYSNWNELGSTSLWKILQKEFGLRALQDTENGRSAR